MIKKKEYKMEFKIKRGYLLITMVDLSLLFLMFVPFIGLVAYAETFFFVLFGIVIATFIMFNISAINAKCEITEDVLLFNAGTYKRVIFLNKIVDVKRLTTISGPLFLDTDRLEIITEEKGKKVFYYISVVDNEKLYGILTAKLPKKAEKKVAPKKEIVEASKPAVKKTTAKKTTTKKPATSKK